MSCIAAISEYGKIYMGSDKLSFDESYQIRNRKDPKIFQNGPYLIGYSGEVRPGQTLRPEFWVPPEDLFLVPDAIREQLAEKGSCQKTSEGSDQTPTIFLIGYKDKVIQIGHDFQIQEYMENFAAIGAGEQYALAVLYHTRKQKDPVKRIKQALEASAYFCGAVGVNTNIFMLENGKATELT